MRQASALFLLFVFGLYHLGYYGFYLIANYQSDNYWNGVTLQAELDEEVLLHAVIPLAIPYQQNQTEYQPANGKVEIDGRYYRVVRQKYANDTLHVIYTADALRQGIERSIDKWIASILPTPASDTDGMHMWKSLVKGFLIEQNVSLVNPTRRIQYCSHYGNVILPCYEFTTTIPFPPPERI